MATLSSTQVAMATTLAVSMVIGSTRAGGVAAVAGLAGEGDRCRAAPGLPLQVRLNNGAYGACYGVIVTVGV